MKNKLLQEIVPVSRCSQLCGCWSEPIANVPIVGIAFSLIVLVRRSVIYAVAAVVVTGKEPLSEGKKKKALLSQMSQTKEV